MNPSSTGISPTGKKGAAHAELLKGEMGLSGPRRLLASLFQGVRPQSGVQRAKAPSGLPKQAYRLSLFAANVPSSQSRFTGAASKASFVCFVVRNHRTRRRPRGRSSE